MDKQMITIEKDKKDDNGVIIVKYYNVDHRESFNLFTNAIHNFMYDTRDGDFSINPEYLKKKFVKAILENEKED